MTQIPISTGYARSLLVAAGHARRKTERDYTFEALTAARKHALRLPHHQLAHDRTIILSDVHKGDRSPGVDDFQHNESVYCEALRFYLGHDYRLILNGDIEEGWKANLSDVIAAYESTTFALEREFDRQGRYHRIYGNHDIAWADPQVVNRHLTPLFGHPMRVYPAVMLGSRIMIAHGHQGEWRADQWARFSRRIVRYLWRPLQSTFELNINRPGGNTPVFHDRDHYLFEWARLNRLLLIAGHTHRALLRPHLISDQYRLIRDQLTHKMASTGDPYRRLHLLSAINHLNAILTSLPGEKTTNPTSHYFNDGCCVHTDGITGIEIDHGEVRLIQWTSPGAVSHPQRAERRVLQSSDLEAIVARL